MSCKQKQSFTLIELLVVIAIIAILAAMLLPALGKVKEQASKTECLNQIKQFTMGVHRYSMDHNDFPPDVQTWYGHERGIGQYVGAYVTWNADSGLRGRQEKMYICPMDKIPLDKRANGWGGVYMKRNANSKWHPLSYGLNGQLFPCRSNAVKGVKISRLKYPARAACIGDSHFPVIGYSANRNWNQTLDFPYRWALLARHSGSTNLSFFDGSIGSLKLSAVPNLSNAEGTINNINTTDPAARAFWFGNNKAW
ncbi:MAG: prepilin-type N-terminal cleavage/methylation domain-containing protein [Lentisphaeria bacterium]|nr:prepilin-type N-terminal cleavage/methylation domain-containing protein [Lentisphaeria bacterium]